jgi:alpha-beta hydrolase superfamily lysophospholipase
VEHFEVNWYTQDNLHIYAQGWQAPITKAVICLVHGLGEHSGRYGGLAGALGLAGYSLLTFDLRGHGRSEGRRGHIYAYERLMEDIDHLLDQAARRFAGQPRFLYGHSMGGNLALNYVLRRKPKLAGVIVTAPWLQLVSPPPALQVHLLRWLDRLWPSLLLSNRLDPQTLSRDLTVVRAYQQDPLVHDRISIRSFHQICEAGAWAMAQAARFPLPLLLIHGSADRLTSPAASRQFAAKAASCTFKLWESFYHEPHHEPEQQELFTFMINWLQRHHPKHLL